MGAFSAGGVNDVVARQWAERVKTLLGTVYVENQGGGTGTIATGEVARAPGDGYTIIIESAKSQSAAETVAQMNAATAATTRPSAVSNPMMPLGASSNSRSLAS